MLNKGLEVLGTDQYPESKVYPGVFEKSALQSITLPNTLRSIEYSAFCACQNLKNVRLPDSLERIGNMCFSGSGLESLAAPPSMKDIGASAFADCRWLASIELSNEVEYLGGKCF